MFDQELNLLIAACRSAYGGGSEGLERYSQEIDWPKFLHLARRHRVQALAWQGLGLLQKEAPAEIAGQFLLDRRSIVETNLRMSAECARLLLRFDEAGVDLLFLKGLIVAALAYPSPSLKMGWDIDILIAPAALGTSVSLLRASGYLSVTPASASNERLHRWHRSRKESVWHHAGSDIFVELHTRLADHPDLLPGIGMRSPKQLVSIAGPIALPTFGKDELFAYLCVHGASSAWFRLKWITDLAALLHRQEGSEIDRLYQRSQQLGAGRAAAQALLLAHRLYATPLSENLRRNLESSAPNQWLAKLACRELADPREPTEHFLGTGGIRLSQLPLLPGWKFPLSEGFRQLREIITSRFGWN